MVEAFLTERGMKFQMTGYEQEKALGACGWD